ncbi:thioesterase II family protein [Xenorhabdus bakwenae]|uniref:thioesterase II family protein n=1 Tax=Xenorhabdus bakwenae TaxID=3026967 RepID=UPI003DA0235A
MCFPFGSGGTSSYRLWYELFDSDVEICPVHLPGRESRYGEEPCLDANILINDLLPELLPLLNCPSIFFGYSLGTALAYKTIVECSKVIRKTQQPPTKVGGCCVIPKYSFDSINEFVFLYCYLS